MADFTDLDLTFRPLATWPQTPTSPRGASRFRAGWSSTMDLLRSEIDHLDPSRVVLEADFRPEHLRRDGYPRGDARPNSPGVILRLELAKGQWMNLPCDTYDDWKSNLRAIALTLEALRAIDRYGVTKNGEQYAGWMAIPAQTGGDPIHSVAGAAAFLAEHAGMEDATDAIANSASVRKIAFRKAATRLHPDTGGSHDDFARLQTAARVLETNQHEAGA